MKKIKNELYPYTKQDVVDEYARIRKENPKTVDSTLTKLDGFLEIKRINEPTDDNNVMAALITNRDTGEEELIILPNGSGYSEDNKKVLFAFLDEMQKGGFFYFFDFPKNENVKANVKDYSKFTIKKKYNSGEYLLQKYLEYRNRMDKLISELKSESLKEIVTSWKEYFRWFDLRYVEKYSQEFELTALKFEEMLLPLYPKEEQHGCRVKAVDILSEWMDHGMEDIK